MAIQRPSVVSAWRRSQLKSGAPSRARPRKLRTGCALDACRGCAGATRKCAATSAGPWSQSEM
eukprot:5909677-Pleurochrysis_carterae.AAC.3